MIAGWCFNSVGMFDCLVVLSFGGCLCVWVVCGICVVFDFSFGVRWFFDLGV